MAYSRTIRLTDTDAAGVIYFASLLSICHEAYEDRLLQSGINLKTFFRNTETALPIVHGEIDFFQPLFCGDRIEIQLIPNPINSHSFEINYQIFLSQSPDKKIAQAKTKHVCINSLSREKKALPEPIQEAVFRDSDHR
ncbi:MAG: 1,4-dihydroxy-2-naphthoyl-CoA hydrolase [Snowella sp.]|nr:MAG: 1,4-dihydroxy-2-naphthoyl-CoA hydrolase [Snowella sp.]